MEFDQDRLGHFAGDKVHLHQRGNGLIFRMEDGFNVVIRGAKRKPMRLPLRRRGECREQGERQNGQEPIDLEQVETSFEEEPHY